MCPAAAPTIDREIERNVDVATAYALLAKTASGYCWVWWRSREVVGALDKLLSVLSQDHIDSLRIESRNNLKRQLQQVHSLLVELSRSEEVAAISRIPGLGHPVAQIQERTDDVGDLIENIVLANNPDFQRLVTECAATIGIGK